jgi:hypothetical protein
MSYSVPILFIVFNRADTASRVLDQLRIIKPTRIYFAADAPRVEKGVEEINACQSARNLINTVDWPCEVKIFYPETNVGARQFIGNAITWMFEYEEKGIILEHDCLPHVDFFAYCKATLDWYQNTEQVMHISGTQFKDIGKSVPEIYFSHYNHIWGWATWKRAWQHYDLEMSGFSNFDVHKKIEQIFPSTTEQKYWSKKLRKAQNGQIGSWDYQWTFAIWNNKGVAVIPGSNLVSNIGFGAGAIHTKDESHFLANRPVYEFPIQQINKPGQITINRISEKYDFRKVFYPSIFKRVTNKIKLILSSI